MKSTALFCFGLLFVTAFATGCPKKGGGATSPTSETEAEPKKPGQAAVPEPNAGFAEANAMINTAAQEWGKKYNGNVKRIWVVGDDWAMQRNDEGRILKRDAWVVLYFEREGKCWTGNYVPNQLSNCVLTQEEQGGKWGKPALWCEWGPGAPFEMDCASVDALPGAAP